MTYGAGLQGQAVYLPAPAPGVMNLVLTWLSQPSQRPRKEPSPSALQPFKSAPVFGTLHNAGRQFQTLIACEWRGEMLCVLLRPWESWCGFPGWRRAHWETWEKEEKQQQKTRPGVKRQGSPEDRPEEEELGWEWSDVAPGGSQSIPERPCGQATRGLFWAGAEEGGGGEMDRNALQGQRER